MEQSIMVRNLNRIEKQNLKEIKRLNQRGGRMLSIIDLINDDTLNLEMSGFLLYSMLNNASFLTAANPMGVGKTTLMGSLLNLIKPEVKIETVNPNQVSNKGEKDVRYLAHELKTTSRPYYGYIKGKDVSKFISLTDNSSIAACMHADTIPEMKDMLFSQGVNKKDFNNIDLILFMRMEGAFTNRKRRISHIYESIGNGHKLLYKWKKKDDVFTKQQESIYLKKLAENKDISLTQIRKKVNKCSDFLENLRENRINHLEDIREKVIQFYNKIN